MRVVDYLAVSITCDAELTEILIAELSYMDYETMMETKEGLEAYIKPNNYNQNALEKLKEQYGFTDYNVSEVIEKNWNEEWEKNYDPIAVENKVRVRATFHEPENGFEYEIIINPRMSFGTGHHATTYLMLKNLFAIDLKRKTVLDAGCGTGILAIMAEKLGASSVLAYDNNSWSAENAPENIGLNECKNIQVQEGTINTIRLENPFDVILANINKNVLLDEMPEYVRNLVKGGKIIFSGFYEKDMGDLKLRAKELDLNYISHTIHNDWACIIFDKN